MRWTWFRLWSQEETEPSLATCRNHIATLLSEGMPFDGVGRLEIRGFNADVPAINRLPNETLTTVLKFHINDYFSRCRHLNECPPSSLLVCRRWRQLAISNPSCWSHINVYIREWPKIKSTKRIVSPRDTKSRAMQDTLIRYFEWAKEYPVNLFIEFDRDFAGGDKQNLMHWISSNMPRLCSYRERRRDRPGGLFLQVLPSLSEDRYSGLTDLAIVPFSGARYRIVQPILMPKLRVLRLMGSSPKYYEDLISNHLDLPNLKTLYIGVANFKLLVAVLEHFPLLTDLAAGSVRIKRMELEDKTIVCRPKANLRRVLLEEFDEKMRYFLIIRPWFEEVLDWSLHSSLLGHLQFAEDFKIGNAEMLTIHCHPGDKSERIQLHDFWRYFSNVIHLTLTGGGKPAFTFTEGYSDNAIPVDIKWSIMMKRLIESVTLVSEKNHLPKYWPRLRSLEVRYLTLSLDDLTLLLDTLKHRPSVASDMDGLENGDSGFRLTIKLSKYSYDGISLPIDEQGMSYSVFKSLIDDLEEKICEAASSYQSEPGKSILGPASPKAYSDKNSTNLSVL